MRIPNQIGFTLVELAMVLIIIAAILGSIVIPLNTQLNANRLNSTAKSLADIKEALLNYAANAGSLPCPAALNSTTGFADHSSCDQEGAIPWAELGTPRYDAWGEVFRYRALNKNLSPFLQVAINNDAGSGITQTDTAVAVIFSVGKNGVADGDTTANNANAVNPYRQGVGVCVQDSRFDDCLIWISNVHVAIRMAKLGKKWEGNGLQSTPIN